MRRLTSSGTASLSGFFQASSRARSTFHVSSSSRGSSLLIDDSTNVGSALVRVLHLLYPCMCCMACVWIGDRETSFYLFSSAANYGITKLYYAS
jgi:hypothetical protein